MPYSVPSPPRLSAVVCLLVWREPGWLVGKSTGLEIEGWRVRIPAAAVVEFSSPQLSRYETIFFFNTFFSSSQYGYGVDMGEGTTMAPSQISFLT